jgi:hypothetical protein
VIALALEQLAPRIRLSPKRGEPFDRRGKSWPSISRCRPILAKTLMNVS